MKYDVTFSCGHTGEVELFGANKDRERKIWVYENRVICPECTAKKNAEANEAAKAESEEKGFAELTGSEKQVAWANTIRADLIKKLEAMKSNPDERVAILTDLYVEAIVTTATSASWWIDNRSCDARSLLARWSKSYPEAYAEVKAAFEKTQESK